MSPCAGSATKKPLQKMRSNKNLSAEDLPVYQGEYNEDKLWKKVGKIAKKAGIKLIYYVLLLYYVLKDPSTPARYRMVIMGALGYFILPADVIPDLLPFAGMADDWAALIAAVSFVASAITPAIKEKAKAQLREAQEMAEEEARDKERIEQLAVEARQDKEQSEIGKNAGKGVAEAIKAVRAMAGDIQEKEFDEGVELLYYRLRSFLRKFRIGILLEAVFAVIALIVFILTEDMRLPMILIDQYTPVMIILLLIVWLFDVTLIRYRKEVLAEEEEAFREQAEREAAEAAAKAEAPANA